MTYSHPLYTPESVAAQRLLPTLGDDRVVFAGAYHGWGFHEDGAASGLRAAERLGAHLAARCPTGGGIRMLTPALYRTRISTCGEPRCATTFGHRAIQLVRRRRRPTAAAMVAAPTREVRRPRPPRGSTPDQSLRQSASTRSLRNMGSTQGRAAHSVVAGPGARLRVQSP